jgi:murein DD-endopeptidase MepM/ murein hydrolase activator NlpD
VIRFARGSISRAWLIAIVSVGCAETATTSTVRVQTAPPRIASKEPEPSCAHLSWPVRGWLSSPFGTRDGNPHEGIDLAVPENTDVHAACDGTVVYADDKLRGYGRLVILKHDSGMSTVYAHNHKLLVHVGESVARGQTIALSGQTGHARGPHVHFEVRLHAIANDPQDFLRDVPPPPPRVAARAAPPLPPRQSTITQVSAPPRIVQAPPPPIVQPPPPAPVAATPLPRLPPEAAEPEPRPLPRLPSPPPDEDLPASETSTIREIAARPISP